MRPHSLHLIAAAALVVCAGQARADTVEFLSYAHGSTAVNFSILGANPTSGSTGAGGFVTRLNGLDPTFTTYCVDLYQYIGFSPQVFGGYTQVSGAAHSFRNVNANADLTKLFAAGHLVNDAISEAAFQIAVWEIAYETSGSYALGLGDALFTGGAADTVLALNMASSWLTSLTGSGSGVALHVLESGANQDELFATKVPEPGTWSLGLAALGVMGWVSRRRRV